MDLGAVLSAAAQAVAQMLVLASAGAFLELTGQLGPTKRAALSNVAFRVFLPALLFTNVAESASAEAMRRQWPLLGYSAMYVCVGYAIGAVLAPRLVAKSDEFSRTHFIFSCALNNVGYLPLILVPATIAQGALHPPGTNIATEIKRGTSHIGLCILVLNIFTWGLAATKLKNVKKDADSAIVKAEATGTAVVVGGQQSTISGAPPAAATPLTVHQRYEARFRSFGIPPRISSSLATCVDVGSNILNPPVAAAAAGMLIGLIPPLRSLFFATKPLGLIETAPTAAVSLSASIDASVANGPSQPSDIPLVSALLPINPATVAAGLSRCTAGMSSGGASSQSASAASQQLLSLFRNGSGWYACTQAAGAAFSAATCCVPLLERTDVFASASTGTIMSASGNTTAAAVNNVLSFGGIYQSLAVASVAAQSIVPPPVPTAPFGPTLTSALQAFASAIVPVVAITLGSNIVAAAPKAPPNLKAKTDPEATNATKALSSVAVVGVLPTSDSSSSICTTVTATSDANAIDDNNKGDCPAVGVDVSMDTSASDIKEIKTPSSKLDYAAAQARKGLKLFIDIVTGLDVTTGEQVIRGRVIAAVAMVRMLIIPILGIVSVYIGSQVGIIPPDRTLQFVLLVEASTPTAMNLQLISDVMGTGSRAMARLIAVTYVASVVTMTIHISIALALIRSGFFNS